MFLISGSKIVNPFRFLEVFETWGPYIDGDVIKEQAVTAFQKGHWQKEKPLLLGKTQREGHDDTLLSSCLWFSQMYFIYILKYFSVFCFCCFIFLLSYTSDRNPYFQQPLQPGCYNNSHDLVTCRTMCDFG